MKIVLTDNFARETVNEKVVAIGITNADFAKQMADALNRKFGGDDSPHYFVVRQDSDPEYIFKP